MDFRIALVDSRPDAPSLIETAGKLLNCEFLSFTNAWEAALHLETHKIDGVIVRLGLPDLQGLELIQGIRGSPLNGEVPIVVTAAVDDIETIREGFKAGATIVLTEPVTTERVHALLKALREPVFREKRRRMRLPLRTTVSCVFGATRDRELTARSFDIGEGGMLLESSEGPELGEELELAFLLPALARPLRPHARIVHKEPLAGVGVEFLQLKKLDRDAIQAYLTGVSSV